jgi:hypothetical protein
MPFTRPFITFGTIPLLLISLAACQPDSGATAEPAATASDALRSDQTPPPDPAIGEYRAFVSEQMDKMAATLSDVFARLKKPRVTDSNWKREIAMQAGLAGAVAVRLAALTPPAQHLADHAAVLSAVRQCSEALSLLVHALDEMDVYMIQEANAKMDECESVFAKAYALWGEVSGG